ncbi:MAG: TIM-barrel domain-containing protein, partial [Lentisphaerota bacterium]
MSVRKTPAIFGNACFTVYSAGCVRLEYSNGGNFSEGPSLLVGKKLAAGGLADVRIKGKQLFIKTEKFELTYTDNGQVFSPENLTIIHKNKEGHRMVWAPGKRDQGNLGTITRSLDQWKWCGGPNHYPQEGILSTDGGHLVQDEPRVYWNNKSDWAECRGHAVQYDGYFFAYGNDYKGALKDFVTVFGPIPMVPRWTFGFWYSRWFAFTDKEVLELAKRYRKEDIPIDVMIIDTDWRHGWGGYDWNPKFFPKPEKTLKQLHDMGLQTSLNDHPGYDNYDGLPANDSHIPAIRKKLGDLPHQGQWACDWSNKKAVETWKDVLLGPLFDQGMDFWWVDGWIKSPFGGLDSQLWANRQYYDLAEEKTGKRGMILSRWGGIGSHRYPVQFSGDTPSEWSMLQHQVEFTVRSGAVGAAYWSHDIGGFFCREKVDEELFVRWFQFGAMSPVFRTHSDHGIREPWNYSEKTKQLFRKQTRIRYALAPYFYNLAREAHEDGLPIIRPLYLEFNDN